MTGVSSRRGIGFAVADRLATLWADVFVHSWTPYHVAMPWGADGAGVDALLHELRRHRTTVAHAEADLGEAAAPAALIDSAAALLGSPDILVANHAHSLSDRLEDLTAPHIDDHLRVNVRATLLLVKEFTARHDRSRPRRVIVLTSGQHLGPMPGELAYVASKGAIQQLTATLAAELMERGTTVNSVNPGPTDSGWADPALVAAAERFPQGRWGRPEDAAQLIAWLATDEAAWVTGQVINSDGRFRG